MKNKSILFGKKLLVLLILVFSFMSVVSQDYANSILGIKLGQLNDCLIPKFGKPFKDEKFEDGWTYKAFVLSKEDSLYVVCEFTKETPDIIQSIQITGNKSNEIIFRGLKIGDSRSAVFKVLGNPIDSVMVSDIKAIRYSFKSANYTIEFVNDKFSSIKIQQLEALFENNDLTIPSYENSVMNIFNKDRETIGDVLCPDIEISKGADLFTFKYTYQDEFQKDLSGVFGILMDKKTGLCSLKNNNLLDENIRISEKMPPLYVFKLKNHPIKEIVLKNYQGSYKIWEIKYK